MMARIGKLHEKELKDGVDKALKQIVKDAAPGFTGTRNKS
jgi:hypothetical protein